VVPEDEGILLDGVKLFVLVLPAGPPVVYVPDVATSLLLLPNGAAVVAALKEALFVYRAI
tara:strand:- start:1329 stop:1508 length:180 start_codon:yes stop_codon:yes gene_type:complete